MTSKASTRIEKVNVAINTPQPKAIIVVINFSDKLVKRDTIQPINRGLEAINPKSNELNMPWDVKKSLILYHIVSSKKVNVRFLITHQTVQTIPEIGYFGISR